MGRSAMMAWRIAMVAALILATAVVDGRRGGRGRGVETVGSFAVHLSNRAGNDELGDSSSSDDSDLSGMRLSASSSELSGLDGEMASLLDGNSGGKVTLEPKANEEHNRKANEQHSRLADELKGFH